MSVSEKLTGAEISLTFEETNRLRQSLGLKPLRSSNSTSNQNEIWQLPRGEGECDRNNVTSADSNSTFDLGARLSQSRKSRFYRQAVAGIEPLISTDKPVATLSHEDVLQRWVESTRAHDSYETARRQDKEVKPCLSPTVSKIGAFVTRPEIREGAVPTLHDTTSVLPSLASCHGSQKTLRKDSHQDGRLGLDELEDASKASKPNLIPTPVAHEDPADKSESTKLGGESHSKFRGENNGKALSVVRPEILTVDSDYHNAPKQFTSFPKRRERRSHKKRCRTSMLPSSVTFQPGVSRGHVEMLRQNADAQLDAEDVGDGDDDDVDSHYAALLRARRITQRLEASGGVNAILEAVRQENDDSVKSSDHNNVVERGARLLYDEMQSFLPRVPKKPQSPSATRQLDSSEHGFMSAADGTVQNEVKHIKSVDSVESTKADGQEWTRTPRNAAEKASNNKSPNSAPCSSEPTGLTGIAATLKRMREMGQLARKKQQSGRARDKRMDYDSLSDEDEKSRSVHGGLDRPNIKLYYVDEQGNDLTPKEAFRMLCHKFHGNTPGKNKNEKRLKKILENLRVRNMHSDDTPLASVAALKQETQKSGTAHVVLSGAQAFQSADKLKMVANGFEDDGNKDHPHSEEEPEDRQAGKRKLEDKVEFVIGVPGTNSVKRRRR